MSRVLCLFEVLGLFHDLSLQHIVVQVAPNVLNHQLHDHFDGFLANLRRKCVLFRVTCVSGLWNMNFPLVQLFSS